MTSLYVIQPTQAQFSEVNGKLQYVSLLDITSPANITYATNQVCLNFTAKAQFDPNVANVTITYRLDNQTKVTVPITFVYVPVGMIMDAEGNPTGKGSTFYSYYLLSGCVDLTDLPQGSHRLSVDARYIDYARNDAYSDSALIYFITEGSSQIASNTEFEQQITLDTDLNDSVSDTELPINVVCAFVGVMSLVIVVFFALFTKRKPKEKNVNM
jgi:hypothetical protein